MRIRIDINGKDLRDIEVINRGQPDGDRSTCDGIDDLCRYEWREVRRDNRPRLSGEVTHWRHLGAETLASTVCHEAFLANARAASGDTQ